MDAVRITWDDSSHHPQGWEFVDAIDPCVTRCETLGFIVAENASSVVVAGSVGRDGSGKITQASGMITIPRCAIVHEEFLD